MTECDLKHNVKNSGFGYNFTSFIQLLCIPRYLLIRLTSTEYSGISVSGVAFRVW